MSGPRDSVTSLTSHGASAIAVVRLAGPGVVRFLGQYFSKPVVSLRCVHGELRDESGEVIDDAVVVLHEDGLSADLNLHGGAWVIAATIDLAKRSGFETGDACESLPGDSSIEREVLDALPLAKTEPGIRMLLAQPIAWQRFLDAKPSREQMDVVLADRCLERLLNPARVAIVGPPNVGKSTLANQLFAQERSITADMPGTTRDWVGEIANIDGVPVMLVDTPGVRDTDDAIEQQAIQSSRKIVRSADLVIYVIDATNPFVPATKMSVVRVLNKIDRGIPPGLKYDVATIATTGQSVDELRQLIRQRLGCDDLRPNSPRCWTQRQRDLLS